ncbi:MAG: hypothetical protein M1828_000841 [Chrysothrix sp. TS-e1954]|nr:MAG: hypothetical protein M1828_000841 [Chrysothrix sp. TS-e1954]
MDHMQMLMVKSASSPSSDPCISGHALMSTAPPSSHIADHPTEPYPHKPPPPGMGNSMHNIAAAPKRNDEDAQRLMQLFDFSNRIQLDGEITPVMAWAMIMADEGAWMWGVGDFERVKGELAGKIRCYGFGAVLEEFEVRDAIRNVIDSKAESQAQGGVLEGPFANL